MANPKYGPIKIQVNLLMVMFRIRRQHVVISGLRIWRWNLKSQLNIFRILQGTLPNWFHGADHHFWCFFIHQTDSGGEVPKSSFVFCPVAANIPILIKKSQVKTVKTCDWCMSKGLKVEYPKNLSIGKSSQKKMAINWRTKIHSQTKTSCKWMSEFYTCTPVCHHFIPLLIYLMFLQV